MTSEHKAAALFRDGDFRSAAQAYRTLAERHPDRLDIQARLGHLDLLANDPDAAVSRLSRVLDRLVIGAFGAQGVTCDVQFPTEIVGCPDGGLLISSVESVAIDEACVRAGIPKDAPRVEHLLERVSPSPQTEPDAGAVLAP